jgi:hypothetical protein
MIAIVRSRYQATTSENTAGWKSDGAVIKCNYELFAKVVSKFRISCKSLSTDTPHVTILIIIIISLLNYVHDRSWETGNLLFVAIIAIITVFICVFCILLKNSNNFKISFINLYKFFNVLSRVCVNTDGVWICDL